MNKASTVKLSLRKLCVAMLAIGPLAILPSPVWAVLPTASSYTVNTGSATLTSSGTVATITAADKTVLQWGLGNFNIASTETWNFALPSNGAILNHVGATGTDSAVINGTLLSSGKVFILANGTISLGAGANVNTSGGLVLSTINESTAGFGISGDLTYSGTSSGAITIGSGATPVTASGNLMAVAGSINVAAATLSGDLVLRSVNSGSALNIATAGPLSIGGNFTATTNNAAIAQGVGIITVGVGTTGNQTASFNTNGNQSISLGVVGNDFEIVSANAGTGAGGDVTLTDANIITLGASSIGGNLLVSAVGATPVLPATTTVAIGTNGAVQVVGSATFVQTGAMASNGIAISSGSKVGTFNASTAGNGTIAYTSTGDVIVGAVSTVNGAVTINTTGVVTASGSLASGTGAITVTGASINQTGTIANTANVTLNATAGNLTLGTITANRVVGNATAGSIAQSGATVITTLQVGGNGSSFNAGSAGTINLTTVGNKFNSGSVIQLTAGTATVANDNVIMLGTSNVTNNLTLTSGANNIVLGTGTGSAAQNITVGGLLTATVTGGTATITDNDYSALTFEGGMNLTTGGGAITLDTASAQGALSPNVRFGRVNASAAGAVVTLSETTALNLGNVTAATLIASSTMGGIVDSGNITVTTGNFTVPATEGIMLDGTGHNIGTLNIVGGNANSIALAENVIVGNVSSMGNLTVTTPAAKNIVVGTGSTTPNITGNVWLTSGGMIDIAGNTTVTGNLTLNAGDTGTTAITQSAGALKVSGVTTISSAGNVTLDTQANDFGSVVLSNVSKSLVLSDINNLTVSGTSAAAVTVQAGAGTTIGNQWNLVLGNLNVGNLSARASNGAGGLSTSGVSGTVTQAAGAWLHVENDASFLSTNGNIIIGNNGNSFGRVQISTGNGTIGNTSGNTTVTFREDGTIKLGNLTNIGATTLTSTMGSIIEDTVNNVAVNTGSGIFTLNAPAGSVLLDGSSRTAGTTVNTIAAPTVNAPNGAVKLITSANMTLGNTSANSLNITTLGTGIIAQSAGVKVFGAASFTTNNGNIVLSNTTNNFGRLSLTLGAAAVDKNITITEAATLNLGTVNMPAASTGNFTATSVTGDIIDSGFAGVKIGGTTASAGSGVVSLTATAGNIILDDVTTEFSTTGGVAFNGGNVTLSPLGNSVLFLGSANTTSKATGNLTVVSAIGNIANVGALEVTGDASFQAANGNITLTNAGNKFGTVKFVGQTVKVNQVNDINIVTGSTATGAAEFTSNSYITIVDRGGMVSLGSTGAFTAAGDILLPKLIQANGALTVFSPGTKNLSALNKVSDLNNINPINLGTGTYLPPQ